MAEAAARDHRDRDAGIVFESCCGEYGSHQQRAFVTDAAGGMFVDGERVKVGGVEGLARGSHCGCKVGELAWRESALKDRHEEAADLCVGDSWRRFFFAAFDHAPDKLIDLFGRQLMAVALVKNEIDRMEDLLGHVHFCWRNCMRKACGSSAPSVVDSFAPLSPG